MSDSDSDEDCGIIRPSLIKQLKSILDQYPDDGQILKELIQNAEDAGATEITFVYDQHSHGTKKLYHKSLDIHQGPSLLAHNNASFKEEDWTGIRSLYESIKENDPLKVGRFGLGFKSVFHLTDLPSILSGQKLLILDPHENILNKKGRPTSGQMWNLKKDKTCLMEMEDQFTPYQGLFGCNIKNLEQGRLRGTLFRFPLRRQTSKLSQTVYHDKRIRTLFESFETDAHLVLLFLKKVERIVLKERKASAGEPQTTFEVKIAEECRETVRMERADFLQKISQKSGNHQNHISSSYRLSIEVLQNDVTNTHHYLIRECYAAGEVSTTFKSLRQELESSYVPMVGVAMQLTEGEAESRSENPEGQTFCVLPLPREQRSSSGLPVHINGYFSVEQNRRHLKWKTTGQHEESHKDVAWNTCLLSEVLPACYADLIKTAIECQKEDRGVSVDDIYAAVPNLSLVDEKWQLLVREMLNLLFQEQWLFTLASGGHWVSLGMSVLDDSATDDDANDDANIVREVLLATGQNVVTPPPHISAAVRNSDIVKVNPQLIRTALQQNQGSYTSLDRERKMALLGAVLQDLTEHGKELHGISLIPLANEKFATFQDQFSRTVYIPSTYQQNVLQALKSQLLDIDIAPNLLTSLRTVAQSGRTCLKEVSPSDMPELIGAALPQEWQGQTKVMHTDRQEPSAQWFEQLWEYLIHSHSPVSLVAFEGLMIMPLTSGFPMEIITLDKNTTVILAHSDGVKLNVKLQQFLKSLGVFIVDRVPEYVLRHPDVLGTYIKSPTTEHVLKAILSASKLLGFKQVASLLFSDYSIADELVTLVNRGLESEGYTPSPTETELLKKLPLFPTTRSIADSVDYASACEVSDSTADSRMLLRLPCRLVFAQNEKTQRVSRFLGVDLLSGPLLLRKYIIPCIKQQQISLEQIRDLMICVSERLPSMAREDGALYGDFSMVAFVETKSPEQADAELKLMKPSELFHPDSSLCQGLFSSIEHVFPSGVYAEQDMLAMLVRMGLRKEEDLQSRDIEQAVLSLHSAPPEKQRDISTSILLALNSKPEVFCRDSSLVNVLRNHPWVPVSRDRIDQYPPSLNWMGSTCFCKPADVVAPKWARILGSVKAVVSDVAQGLEEVFSWQERPSPHLVVQHLKNVVESYHLDDKAAYLSIVLETYKFFDECCCKEELEEALKSCPKWLWVGDKFALAENVVLERNFMSLYPFVHSLPEELYFLKPMLSGLGVRTNVDHDMSMLVNVLHRIKHVNEEQNSLGTSEQNLQMVVAILNHIRKSLTHMDGSLKDRLLAPEDCEPGEIFKLQLVKDCTYCDKEWLRKGLDLKHVDAEKENIKLIHRDIPLDTARDLGVTPLIQRMLHAEQWQITPFGQSESLANRIRHLLEDYTDGLAVFKEMVQNADDAGATEVKFLYDERTNDDRTNDDARTCLRLLDPKLKECQGAALWVYNDAVFKEEDFNNIISLGDSSKEKALDKVGKFGLGFNVVYNLTEVPSFVTGESLVMFDPQMSHLRDVIKDKSNPGIKLNLQQNKPLFRSCSDQFLPYQGVYGCDLLENPDDFQGTLFRLPLRTAFQASRSKLSPNHYSKTEMIELLKMLKDNAHRILLFTQNVTNLTLDYLPQDGGPDQPISIFTAQKNVVNILKELSSSKGKVNLSPGASGMLSFVAKNADALDDRSRLATLIRTTKKELPGSKELYTKEKCSSKRVRSEPEHRHWIISTVIRKQPGLTTGNPGFQIGGIAMQVQKEIGVDVGCLPQSLKDIKERGQVFCGLPLPFYCDLPVHINGNFALHSSRRAFPQGTGDDKHHDKIEWNKRLMQEVLSEAYLHALEDTAPLLPKGARVEFHQLWPLLEVSKKDHEDVSPLLDAFFSKLLIRPDFPLLYDKTGLVTMEKAVFLDEQLVANEDIKETVLETMSQLRPGFSSVVLPLLAFKKLQGSDQATIAVEKWYDIHRYFKEVFFPNLEKIPDEEREKLVLFALSNECICELELDALGYVRILSSLKEAYVEEALKPPFLHLACSVLKCLGIALQKNKTLAEDLEQTVFVPNEKHILMPLKSLYYTDDAGRENDSIVSKDVPHATVRALGVKSWREFLYDNNSRGIPFGQCEDLPNAIKRVLETYPRDQGILKELIQNADDAGATKIHFILDKRHHPYERLFDKSWRPLQGPALCVYSDSSFTKQDLEGIQAFGIGAKRQDSSKTGQYGIGFNSVYHLTDVPSVLTSGPDVPKTLCVFDPQCKFVRGATTENRGRQYNDLEDLKEEFPDVFTCYLEEHFSSEHATVLRLPLRNETMASDSLISNRSSPDIETMFSSLAKEAKETLLFLGNVREIEMSEITPVGKTDRVSRLYKFEARICQQVQGCRPDTADKSEKAIRHLLTQKRSMESTPLLTSCKCLEIAEIGSREEKNRKEKWFVVESFGLEHNVIIPSSVTEMIESEFRLLPKGGVAAPISSSIHSYSFKGKAFCTLPLPLETGLPVHVNGHFALGHENRRHLWTYSDREGYTNEWNDFLCENVISVAYVRLIEALKGLISDTTVERGTLRHQLSHYQSYFPVYTDEVKKWHVLIKAFYKRLASGQVPTLPVVTSSAQDKGHKNTRTILDSVTVKWNTYQTEGRLKVYFPESPTLNAEKESGTRERMEKREKDLKEKNVLHQCLVRCHFAVLDITEEITRGFEQSDVQITRLSPGEVLSGFPLRPLCQPGALPQKIEKTPFQKEETLKILVKYCAQDEHFVEALECMPFLLSADGQLHKFNPESPAYYTSFQGIFPSSAHMFIKDSSVFKKISPCSVMKPFAIAELPGALKSNLPPTLSAAPKIKMEEAIRLRGWSQKLIPELPRVPLATSETKKTEKLNRWLASFWNFVEEQLKDLLEKPERRQRLRIGDRKKLERKWLTELKRKATQRLKCIEDWCLIPTKKLEDTYLVSISTSSMVLGRGENSSVFNILLRCGAHVLHSAYESSFDDLDPPNSILSAVVTTTEDARACLHILHSALQETWTPLKEDDAKKLRTFFCEHLEMLHNDQSSASELKHLPIYKSVFGKLSDLSGYNVVYQLAKGTPTAGIEVSQTKTGALFLECDETCDETHEPLYSFLGVQYIDRVFFYRDFIFQHFEMYSEEERAAHLWYLHQYTQKDDNESTQLLENMKNLAIITATDGSLKQGNYFYDQHNPVFAAFMFELAPPTHVEPFEDGTWHDFLSKAGLVRELSPEAFLNCARQVASQRPCDQTLAKSRVLMNYLFDMKSISQQQTTDVFSDQDFDKFSKIVFVEPALVSGELANMCPQLVLKGGFMELSGAIPSEHEELVWTQVTLLPTWADPYFAPLDPKARDELRQVLGILEKPPTSLVLKHLCTLADYLSRTEIEHDQSQQTKKIFKKIYMFLQQQDDQEIPSMRETRCILVENGRTLVAPKQIVRTLSQQIVPFLYQIPNEMMAFQDLFLRLGGTERPTVEHYVMVLEKLYMETKFGVTVMGLNQTKRAFLAVKGLFGTLDFSNNTFPDEPLYLPSVDRMMCLSTKLVYNDVPSLFSRIKNLDGKQLVNLADCGIASSQVVGAVEKLPKQHQPRFVSQEVEETLDGANQIHDESEVANQVTTRVKSEVFRKAVKQLLLHEDFSHNRRPEKREIQEAVDRLGMVKVQAVDRVQTILRDKQTRDTITGSVAHKVCHVEKRKTGDSYQWDIYIKKCLSLNELLIPLAKAINQILDGKLQTSVLNLFPLITCQEDSIVDVLKGFDVNVGVMGINPTLPTPGKELCSIHRNIITPGASRRIRIDEYVAVALDGNAFPVYAVVLAVPEETDAVFLLDVGQSEPLKVKADKIFTI